MPESSGWHYRIGQRDCGPVSANDLKRLTADGKLGPDDLVRRGGEEGWVPAAKVRGLFPQPPLPSTPAPVAPINPPTDPMSLPEPPDPDRPSGGLWSGRGRLVLGLSIAAGLLVVAGVAALALTGRPKPVALDARPVLPVSNPPAVPTGPATVPPSTAGGAEDDVLTCSLDRYAGEDGRAAWDAMMDARAKDGAAREAELIAAEADQRVANAEKELAAREKGVEEASQRLGKKPSAAPAKPKPPGMPDIALDPEEYQRLRRKGLTDEQLLAQYGHKTSPKRIQDGLNPLAEYQRAQDLLGEAKRGLEFSKKLAVQEKETATRRRAEADKAKKLAIERKREADATLPARVASETGGAASGSENTDENRRRIAAGLAGKGIREIRAKFGSPDVMWQNPNQPNMRLYGWTLGGGTTDIVVVKVIMHALDSRLPDADLGDAHVLSRARVEVLKKSLANASSGR